VAFSDSFEIVNRVLERNAELILLRRAVGPYVWRHSWISEQIEGKTISEATACLLALVIFDGYELFPEIPVNPVSDVESQAKLAGTFNALDRSRQYRRDEPRELLRAVNEAWTKIRKLENEGTRKDAEIAKLYNKLRRSNFVNVTLTAIITSLAMKGLELLIQSWR
jgi:hypothetical protein